MENQGIINKIKSVYIIQNIFNYIKDNKIQFKLFRHSKYFQKKLNINFLDCKEKYLKNIGFNINDYLFLKEEEYENNFLNKKYKDFLLKNKINKKLFETLIYEICENNQIKERNNKKENFICIDSPLFEVISKINNFEDYYTLYISQACIDNLKNEYHNKLNNPNLKYVSLFYCTNYIEIESLKRLYFDFNKIKKMKFKNNNLSNLNFLEKIKLQESKELHFSYNYISDIDPLKKLKFEKLEILNLEWNNISNIDILKKVNFKELKELNLRNNKLSNIKALKKVKFEIIRNIKFRME